MAPAWLFVWGSLTDQMQPTSDEDKIARDHGTPRVADSPSA